MKMVIWIRCRSAVFAVVMAVIALNAVQVCGVGCVLQSEHDVKVAVSPSLIHSELGSFLWVAQTDIGSVTVRNMGAIPVRIVTQFHDAVHDQNGGVLPGSTCRAAALITANPAACSIPVGSEVRIRLRADKAIALGKIKGVTAVMGISVTTSADGEGHTKGIAMSPAVTVPVLVRSAGVRENALRALGVERNSDGLWVTLYNAGEAYAWSGGKVELGEGTCLRSLPIDSNLLFPGCRRRVAVKAERGADELPDDAFPVTVRLPGAEPVSHTVYPTKGAVPARP